jgi:O-acetyl-ADP-ribose deacetylase (regulator of RNase III)
MRNAFALASEKEIVTIAIPAVGTGIAGFPIDECSRVMAECLSEALSHGWQPQEVRFVLFGEDSKEVFEAAFWRVFRPNV